MPGGLTQQHATSYTTPRDATRPTVTAARPGRRCCPAVTAYCPDLPRFHQPCSWCVALPAATRTGTWRPLPLPHGRTLTPG